MKSILARSTVIILCVATECGAGTIYQRAYPPSCFDGQESYPLPLSEQATGPTVSGEMTVESLSNDFETVRVRVTMWRQPCDQDLGAVLIEFRNLDMAPGGLFGGDWPVPGAMPLVLEESTFQPIRLAIEPNAQISEAPSMIGWSPPTSFDVPPLASTVVLDHYVPEAYVGRSVDNRIDFSAPLTLNFIGSGENSNLQLSLPAYNAADFPTPGDVTLNGRLTGAFYDPIRDGEGILFEVYEQTDNVGAITQSGVFLTWFTHADGGDMWLAGNAQISFFQSEVTIPLLRKQGGQFGDAFDPGQLSDIDWGSITLSFPDCNHLNASYQGIDGSGTLNYERLTQIEGQICR